MNNKDSFLRYLASKTTVDNRALNQGAWQQLLGSLSDFSENRPLRILEIGAGIGTMVERLLSQAKLPPTIYTAVDINSAAMDLAKRRLKNLPPQIELHLKTQDVFEFIDLHQDHDSWDLIIAHAFLDLVDLSSTIPKLFSLLQPGGLFYFTLNFDGSTILEPHIDRAFDAEIEARYHQTMDDRITNTKPSGDSQTGRHLFKHLIASGGEILSAGSSDWVVFAGKEGYLADEAYFLGYIINTIGSALEHCSELDQTRFKEWLAQRHAQIDRNELIYIARQLDFFGKVTP